MSFKFRLIATVLAAIVALGGLNLAALHQVRALDRETFAFHRDEGRRVVLARIAEIFDELDSAAIHLSKPREIVNALAAADNEALHDWSAAFVGNVDRGARVDEIVFADLDGVVVARAAAEFRFGDSIAATRAFATARASGRFLGVGEIDGRPALVAVRTLRKYDDLPVGIVVVAGAITPELLSAVTGSSNVVLSYADDAARVSGRGALPTETALFHEALDAPYTDGRFALAFLPDPRHERMLTLQSLMSFGAIAASLLTLAALLAVLRRQLAPYQAIVGGLLEYANRGVGLGGLRARLAPLRARRGEAAQVADALTQMIDSVDASFRRFARHADELEVMARADSLTALANRRGIEEALEAELRRTHRYGGGFAVILIDIDHFKTVNDRFGHPAGDDVLRRFADLLHANSRATDSVGRWGGEEFLLLCPGADADAAAAHAETLRRLVAAAFADDLAITASFGVAAAQPGDSLEAVVARADRALYAAKADGRNAVRTL